MHEIMGYYLDLYKSKTKRIRQYNLILLTLLGIAYLNFEDHRFEYKHFYQNLNTVLFHYTLENEDILKAWCAEQYYSELNDKNGYIKKQDDANDKYVISFQNEPIKNNAITWDSIPTLRSYLETHGPDLRRYNTLFSWKLPFYLFMIAGAMLPLIIVVLIGLKILGLLKIKRHIREKNSIDYETKLILLSVFSSRIKFYKNEFPGLQAILSFVVYFTTVFLSSYLFMIAPRNAARYLSGKLYIGFTKLPDITIGEVSYDLPSFQTFLAIEYTVAIIVILILTINYYRLIRN